MRGKPRLDDRRVISGIVQVLKSGGRWVDAPPEYGPRKTLCNRFVRWADKGVWTALFHALAQNWRASRPSSHRQFGDQGASLCRRRQRGEKNQAIGRSRGGRTTKIRALTDAQCRPPAFMLNGGHVADCTAGAALLERLPACDILHADKGYDATAMLDRLTHYCEISRLATKAGDSRTAPDQSKAPSWTPERLRLRNLDQRRRGCSGTLGMSPEGDSLQSEKGEPVQSELTPRERWSVQIVRMPHGERAAPWPPAS
jgi:transposase